MTHFTDSVLSKKSTTLSAIIDRSLAGRAFFHGKSRSLLHTTHGKYFNPIPQKQQFSPPTHLTGASRAPP
jgi:hypothetical protein